MDASWRKKFKKLHEELEKDNCKDITLDLAFYEFKSDFSSSSGINFSFQPTTKDMIDEYIHQADYVAFLAALMLLE